MSFAKVMGGKGQGTGPETVQGETVQWLLSKYVDGIKPAILLVRHTVLYERVVPSL